jgi:hypothetical protein
MPMWNPIAHSCSSALGSFILDDFTSQIMPGMPFQNVWEHRKLKRVGSATHGRPTLLTTTKGGRSSCWTTRKCHPRSKMSFTRHLGDLEMSQYALWNMSSGAKLVHIHQKWWACEPTTIASTCTGSLIQPLICNHATNTIGWKSPKGETFFNTYAHECN